MLLHTSSLPLRHGGALPTRDAKLSTPQGLPEVHWAFELHEIVPVRAGQPQRRSARCQQQTAASELRRHHGALEQPSII
ncbi:hypothetical protein GQ55_2G483500 [Panicum hallii var. hallii]|uniref:Uncharacterized protein n=1 Tax=Panicum hallii var. hallii TaxID=1504633 RepID=A0A2T7F0E4_9POAL|nr:hypothetical protein GQ55_2G483500 [Panicum hallii var. hallii]